MATVQVDLDYHQPAHWSKPDDENDYYYHVVLQGVDGVYTSVTLIGVRESFEALRDALDKLLS